MNCPYCGHSDTKVLDKRDNEELDIIKRRRECLKCKKRFTTHERIEAANLFFIKKDGTKEKFDRGKILAGLSKACEKRPITAERIAKTADAIERALRRKSTIEIKSTEIGEFVIKKLRALDSVAYIRFASVYKDFGNLKTFEKEIRELKNNGEKTAK